jgi:hypothetical protein
MQQLARIQHPQTLRLGRSGFRKTPKIPDAMIHGHVVLWILDARVLQ